MLDIHKWQSSHCFVHTNLLYKGHLLTYTCERGGWDLGGLLSLTPPLPSISPSLTPHYVLRYLRLCRTCEISTSLALARPPGQCGRTGHRRASAPLLARALVGIDEGLHEDSHHAKLRTQSMLCRCRRQRWVSRPWRTWPWPAWRWGFPAGRGRQVRCTCLGSPRRPPGCACPPKTRSQGAPRQC